MAYLGTAIAVLAVACRLRLPGTSVHKFVLIGGIAGCVMLAQLYLEGGLGSGLIATALCYAFLCELYIFFFTMVGSSISASMLLRLRHGALPEQTVAERYHPKMMVEERIGNLIQVGLMQRTPAGILILTPQGDKLNSTFRRLQLFFRHTDPETFRTPARGNFR
ncbi:hypothetical protein [Skermanella aerolata]|uniref:hypothetical protein n=1 Tax=Skermanella aerolata TaxID=393310 RepID=UPI0011BEC74E|nr:hypothetical protein [Skermanella aerolata]